MRAATATAPKRAKSPRSRPDLTVRQTFEYEILILDNRIGGIDPSDAEQLRSALGLTRDNLSRVVDPEHRLMLRMIEDAIYILLSPPPGRSARLQRAARRDASAWIFSGLSGKWIFSFESCCEWLGLEPTYIQRLVRKLLKNQ